jgi:hypothetical protein
VAPEGAERRQPQQHGQGEEHHCVQADPDVVHGGVLSCVK